MQLVPVPGSQQSCFVVHDHSGFTVTRATIHNTSYPLLRQWVVLCATTIFSLLSPPSVAATWEIKPSLVLSENYSTNISRARLGQEQKDWVTQINPSLVLSIDGPKLKLVANYHMQNSLYAANSRMNATRHELHATANGKLYEDMLLMDGKASISQYNINPLGQQTFNAFNTQANRADVRTFSVSPYLRGRYKGLVNGEIRYTLGSVSSTAFGLSNNRTDSLALSASSGHSFTVLRWNLYYSKQKSTYSGFPTSINNSNYGAKFNYMITPRLSLDASTGYEKSDYVSIARPPKGASNMVGFTWAPSLRTHVDLQAGRRAYGPSLSFNVKHHSRKSLWNIAYTEDITTTQSQFLANAGQAAPLFGPTNFLSNQVFLQKRLSASVTVTGHRNDLTFSLFESSRDAQTPQVQNLALLGAANLALGNRSKQRGGSASWNSKLSPFITSNLTAGYNRNDFLAAGISSQDRNLMLRITTQLQPDLSYSLSLLHNQHESSQINFNSRESAIAAALMMQF
ncbi:MAG: TIGR03016 family PEP-CTERM system-associated outer membrane protein [Gallionella sp.]|nr:TIGR03016 family PEP-CTERM system-associated outer membrane protein [Gallionella sp.]MDD4946936.1 TIGR03016 family PEP-CTERM system-associated outer membrane protein [Gallionella sp.]MDD5611572.1 TIGR03016 family PEP-CTERM system-associated outer membrane protein [Gallionella sp.]